jgi:ribosomal protein L30/L7E
VALSSVAERLQSIAHTPGQRQPRLVRPTPGRLRRGTGDVLVVLSRGLAGKSVAFVRTAHSLGLVKWGDQALGWASDKAWLGQINAIAHLVTVTYLGEILVCSDHGKSPNARPPTPEELLVSKWSGAYQNRGTSGYFQRLMNDEYLHAERQSNGRRSVMWSTEQPLDAFLKMISRMLPEPRQGEEARWLTAEDEQDAPTAKILVNGPGRDANVHLLNAQFPGTTVIWRRPFRKLVDSSRPHAEAAFLYARDHPIDQSQVRAALSATGSPVVRHAVKTQPGLLDDVLDGAK